MSLNIKAGNDSLRAGGNDFPLVGQRDQTCQL
jgi:hypothetical protein